MTETGLSRPRDARQPATRRLRRALRLIVAFLQLFIPAFASGADARAEGEAQRVHAHVEAYGTTACPRDHDIDCIVCRLIHAGAATERRATLVPHTTLRVVGQPAHRNALASPTRRAGDPPQRAPPI